MATVTICNDSGAQENKLLSQLRHRYCVNHSAHIIEIYLSKQLYDTGILTPVLQIRTGALGELHNSTQSHVDNKQRSRNSEPDLTPNSMLIICGYTPPNSEGIRNDKIITLSKCGFIVALVKKEAYLFKYIKSSFCQSS